MFPHNAFAEYETIPMEFRSIESRWTLRKHAAYQGIDRDGQVPLQKVFAGVAAGGITREQASQLRLTCRLIFDRLHVRASVHVALIHALGLKLSSQEHLLVMRVYPLERIDGNRVESIPALPVCSRRRPGIAVFARQCTFTAIGYQESMRLVGHFLV